MGPGNVREPDERSQSCKGERVDRREENTLAASLKMLCTCQHAIADKIETKDNSQEGYSIEKDQDILW